MQIYQSVTISIFYCVSPVRRAKPVLLFPPVEHSVAIHVERAIGEPVRERHVMRERRRRVGHLLLEGFADTVGVGVIPKHELRMSACDGNEALRPERPDTIRCIKYDRSMHHIGVHENLDGEAVGCMEETFKPRKEIH